MKPRTIGKIMTFVMSVYMSAAFCQQPEINEEAHRLTLGWRFVLANQTLLSHGSLMENPVILFVYEVDEFEESRVSEEIENVRILERPDSEYTIPFGFLTVFGFEPDRNTYSVTEYQHSDDLDLDDLRARDVLIGIESSGVPSAFAETAERFILETIEPEVPG